MANLKEAKDNKLGFSVKEISQLTTLSRSYIRLEIHRGNLKAKVFGRRLVVMRMDLERYLATGRNVSPAN